MTVPVEDGELVRVTLPVGVAVCELLFVFDDESDDDGVSLLVYEGLVPVESAGVGVRLSDIDREMVECGVIEGEKVADEVSEPDGVTVTVAEVVENALLVSEPVKEALAPIESVAVADFVIVAVTEIVVEEEVDMLDEGD